MGVVQQCLLDAALSTLQQLHLCPQIVAELSNDPASYTDQVNVIVNFESSITGYALFSLSRRAATTVISMMKGRPITELSETSMSALGALCSKMLGDTLGSINPATQTLLSPPTIITGENVFLPNDATNKAHLVLSCRGHKLTFFLGYINEPLPLSESSLTATGTLPYERSWN